MKNIFTLILLSLSLFEIRAIAQTSTRCNAKFSWQYLGENIIQFNPLLTEDTVTIHHNWVFGDGDSTTIVIPTHTYLTTDSFIVKHYVYKTTLNGIVECRDSLTSVIQISLCNIHADYTWAADSNNTRKIIFTNQTPTTNATATWFFGDSTSGTGWNTFHEYKKPGRYKVCLVVETDSTCRKYYCDSITVSSASSCNIHAGYTWAADSNNSRKIIFTNQTLTTNATATWFFGDSTSGTGWNTFHEYKKPGRYKVCLVVETDSTCRKYYCDSITVSSALSCNIHAGYTWSADSNNTRKIIFTNQTPTTNATATWVFGDSTSGTGWNTFHEYKEPGRYKVCLIVETDSTCRKYYCDSITVSSASSCNIHAGYTWAADSNNTRKIIFTNQTPTTNATATWFFGDGTSGTGWNTFHEYSKSGRYKVCLIIQTDSTCRNYHCDSITVSSASWCNIHAGYAWAADSNNTRKIIFTNQTITPTTNATATWFFGDGTSGTGWNTFHEYSKSGRYKVCLIVQTDSTCRSYHCDSVTVHWQEPGCIEQSYFTFSHLSSDLQSYQFIPAFVNNSWQYTWAFGDGTGSHDIGSTHRYLQSGTYTACLTVFRNENCASTTCKSLITAAQPNCDSIKVTYDYQRDPALVNRLYFSASNNLIDQTWTFTKLRSTVSTPVILHQDNPSYLFTDTGYYRVCLNVATTDGCVKEYCQVIYIESITASNSCILKPYPNPASTEVNVIVMLPQPELIYVYVYTSLNVLIKEKHQTGIPGSNVITLSVGNLFAGLYYIKIVSGNDVCYARFQKL